MIALLVFSLLVTATDLTPERAAAISRELAKAQAEVEKKYGDRKATDLSSQERRDRSKDLSDAESAVLGKNEIEAKDWSRYNTRLGKEGQAAKASAELKLAEKEKSDAEAAEKLKTTKNGDIEVLKLTAQPPAGKDDIKVLNPSAAASETATPATEEPTAPAPPQKKSKGGKR